MVMTVSFDNYAKSVVPRLGFGITYRHHAAAKACWMLASDGAVEPPGWFDGVSDAAALVAYATKPEGYATHYRYHQRIVGVTEATNMGFLPLYELLLHEGLEEEALAFVNTLKAADAATSTGISDYQYQPEHSARRLPCPYALAPISYREALPKALRGADFGIPRSVTASRLNRFIENCASATVGYYMLGWADYLGLEITPPATLPSSVRTPWWKLAFLVKNFGDRVNYRGAFTKSNEALYLMQPDATEEEQVRGLRAYLKLVTDTQIELHPFLPKLSADVITSVRSKYLPHALIDMPWHCVGEALSSDDVRTYLLAFLDHRIDYSAVFKDHPKRSRVLRVPTRAELQYGEEQWLFLTSKLLAARRAAIEIRRELLELGGGPYGAFLLLASSYDDEFKDVVVAHPDVAMRTECLLSTANAYGLLTGETYLIGDTVYHSSPELLTPSAAYYANNVPRYFV